jgi:hypothetical protein
MRYSIGGRLDLSCQTPGHFDAALVSAKGARAGHLGEIAAARRQDLNSGIE